MWRNQSTVIRYEGRQWQLPNNMVASRLCYAGMMVFPDRSYVIITNLDIKTDPPTLLGLKNDLFIEDTHMSPADVAEWLSRHGVDEYRPVIPTYLVSAIP